MNGSLESASKGSGMRAAGEDASEHGAQSVAVIALAAGLVIMALKMGVYVLTDSAAVLSDALESTVNLAAAAVAIWTTWYAAKPADEAHPYGHGRVEFFAVGLEGALVLMAGLTIIYEASHRLMEGRGPGDLDLGILLLSGVSVLAGALAAFVWRKGAKLDSPTLIADGKHLATDVLTSLGVLIGLILVKVTGILWLDAGIALVLALVILLTGGRLVMHSWSGFMDRIDPVDDAAIRTILDAEVVAGRISGYHKVRHRHQGSFHWVDLHIQVPGQMTVAEAHRVASEIEHAIESRLGRADATSHVEPA